MLLIKLAITVLKILKMMTIYIITPFVSRKNEYIAFGSWTGKYYNDNSKYLAEYIGENYKQLKLYWIGDKTLKHIISKNPNLTFLKKNSFKSLLILLKCKYIFCSQMHDSDISEFNVFIGAKICYLHHGIPVKKWGDDAINNTSQQNKIKQYYLNTISSYFGRNRKYNYFISASPQNDLANYSALKFRGCNMSNNIASGTPRNDFFINYDINLSKSLKKQYATLLSFKCSKKIIMYLPTYRRTNSEMKTFVSLNKNDSNRIQILLEKNNAILLEKNHFATKKNLNNVDYKHTPKNVIKITQDVNIQEMLHFTDILISDYSGAYLDFILLDRPVIHFTYDLDYYMNVDSGLYYSIEDFSAGAITFTFKETLDELEKLLNNEDNYSTKRDYVKEKYMKYEKGNACKTIVSKVISNK